MAQQTISQASKVTGDDYTAAEHNEIVTVINTNSADVEDRVGAIEALPLNTGDIVQVTTASDLSGTLDSTKTYIVNGTVDMGSTSVAVPSGGLTLVGHHYNSSSLESSENSYTLFTGATAGNVFVSDLSLSASGTSSQVFDLTANTGFEAIEFTNVNFNDCTSLGELTGYRQGFESNTGRFGGSPALTFSGTWLGGYRITSSILRNATAGFGDLFIEGTTFTMGSRFLIELNVDLPAGTDGLCDFKASVFSSPALFQWDNCIVTRAGVFDRTDANYFPNLGATAIASAFSNNRGIANTYVGGRRSVTSETTTTITTINTPVVIAGTFDSTDLDHFDAPATNQLRNLGRNDQEVRVTVIGQVEGTSGEVLTVRVMHYDASAASASEVVPQQRGVLSLVGSNDVALINIIGYAVLDTDDYLYLDVANNTSTNNVTLQTASFLLVEVR